MWLPQQHFIPWYRPTGGKAATLLLCFSLFPKRGKSAAWLLVNKQPTKCMFIVQEHLFLPGRQLLCLSPRGCTGHWSHRWKQKTGHHSDLVGLSTPLFSPSPFSFFFFSPCGLPSSLSPQSRGEWSIIKIVMQAQRVGLSGSPPLQPDTG